jgi:hypothetical protein
MSVVFDADSILHTMTLMDADSIVNLCQTSREFARVCNHNKRFVCKQILYNLGFDFGDRNRSLDCKIVKFLLSVKQPLRDLDPLEALVTAVVQKVDPEITQTLLQWTINSNSGNASLAETISRHLLDSY